MYYLVTRLCCADDDGDWCDEDGSPAASAARSAPRRPVLGVRRRRVAAADGLVHPHLALAGVHLLRHRVLRAPETRYANQVSTAAAHRRTTTLGLLCPHGVKR